jgi:LmbE family N-acetylglucosaminyl deacetylase
MDTNPDHCALKISNEQAGRGISTFEFETPNAYNFVPSYFVSLTEEEVELKLEMMRCHSSQNEKNSDFYLKKIKSTAEFRGLSIYEDFAEAYFPVRVRV